MNIRHLCVFVACAALALTPQSLMAQAQTVPSHEVALEQFLETGEAPIVSQPAESSFPYDGSGVATVRCQPYRACALQLEAGETIQGRVLGDTENWEWVELVNGPAPLVVVKPSIYDARTNALIVTGRRVYQLELVSPPREKAAATGYDSLVTWWYPEEWAVSHQRSLEQEAEARQREADRQALPGVAFGSSRLEDIHLDYEVRKPLWRRLRWEPKAVMDDGEITVVQLPWEARNQEPPVALGVLDGDEAVPLNSRLDPTGAWLIVPTVVDRLRLVVGERHLTLVRREGRDHD